ncbi:hypothetical protein H4P12_15895 [Paracoccus sp. 11-3]|uniref:Uncharacterized protein n=1 Tax=Paracoccus amoyensis TaxID=2760093 RepID=A0A926GJ36_9RHOB|nr:hypothetical protein [Paracoccus amoyensis]MBC9248159.1 hypothetical protein [Paracoccus amoyensis]
MRKIFCTTLAAALATFAQPVFAQLTEGCYIREYSDVHLASQPVQHIKALKGVVPAKGAIDSDGDDISVWALMADQGQARQSGLGGPGVAPILILRR